MQAVSYIHYVISHKILCTWDPCLRVYILGNIFLNINPETPKVFRQPKRPRWWVPDSLIFALPSDLKKIFLMSMYSGSKNPTVIMQKLLFAVKEFRGEGIGHVPLLVRQLLSAQAMRTNRKHGMTLFVKATMVTHDKNPFVKSQICHCTSRHVT